MSCGERSNRFARLAAKLAAISVLANKRGFYGALALGAGGLIGAGVIARVRRVSRASKQPLAPANGPASPAVLPQLPHLSTPVRVQAQTAPGQGERCARCGASGAAKKGGWYQINGRSYCQDCAPQAGRQAGVELAAAPPRLSTRTGQPNAGPALLQPVPGLWQPTVSWLPPENRVPLELKRSPIRLHVGAQPNGQPAWYVVQRGYVALRLDGQDTGLAITPAVQIGALQADGTQKVTEDPNQWLITHISSGKSLGNRAFNDLESAKLLASVLAQLDWTKEEHQIPGRDINRVNQTFHYYDQALKQNGTENMGAGRANRGISLAGRPVSGAGDLTGQLVADNVGGVARVLEDKGARLYVADSYGQRYEIYRSEIRKPQENDFSINRIALPLDPALNKNKLCHKCGAAAVDFIGSGQPWYRMDYQDFCPTCSTRFADQEGYEMPDTIGRL